MTMDLQNIEISTTTNGLLVTLICNYPFHCSLQEIVHRHEEKHTFPLYRAFKFDQQPTERPSNTLRIIILEINSL